MPMSIFRKNEEEKAPEIEVQGEEIVVRQEETGDEEKPEPRRVKMPKTKWA